MEKRIRIIWLLSLTAMLLLVLVQGYWLFSQCRYKSVELRDQLYEQVEQALELTDSVRRTEQRVYNGPSQKRSYGYSISLSRKNGSPLADYALCIYQNDSLGTSVVEDTIRFATSRELNFLDTELKDYLLQKEVPFTLARIDSVLALMLPGVSFESRLCPIPPTEYMQQDSVSLEGSRLHPVVCIRHPYSTLHWQMVEIVLKPPFSVLLWQMWQQVLGSLLLVLFLGICLWLQMKTIWRQWRIEELRSSFTSTMIHELKRPVQTLKMCVAMLRDSSLQTDRKSMDEVVHDSAVEVDNLSAYLQKLRDMNRTDNGQLVLTRSSFALRPLVENLAAACRKGSDKPVDIEVCVPEEMVMTADRMHLTNVLNNLLENAVKYSQGTVRIEIGAERRADGLHLWVSDNGIGIAASDLPHVFEKFYRGAHLPDPAIPGIGLGLSYVKLLVEAHGGRVTLTSRLRVGTRVELFFPD